MQRRLDSGKVLNSLHKHFMKANLLQVDLTYVEAAAAAAKAGGVRHFSLVTSKGASARLPAPHFAGLHPLLYLATKGRAEEAVKAQVQRGPAIWLTVVPAEY